MKKISIIIPCYQNELNIDSLIKGLIELYEKIRNTYQLQVITVDDGSTDKTHEKLIQYQKSHLPFEFVIIKLIKNFGSYNAFLAGLNFANGEAYIQLHADLQDPPDKLPEMLDYWNEGEKLVIGVRTKRETDFVSNLFSGIYHRTVKSIALPHIPDGGFDLIVFDKLIRDEIVKRNETNINVIYQIASLVDSFKVVSITRKKRTEGKSQWTFSKKVKLFIDTIVGFSYAPIRFLTLASIVNIIFTCIAIVLINKYINPLEIKILSIYITIILCFIFIGISMIGEYLWRALEASRRRPPYIIEKISHNQQ